MEQPQFNHRIDPQLKDRFNGFMQQYRKDGRIQKNGDFFGLLLNDHLFLEKKRAFLENCNDRSKEINDHLDRIFDLIQQMEVGHNNEVNLITKKCNQELMLKDLRIEQLENKLSALTEVFEVRKNQDINLVGNKKQKSG